MKTRLHHVCIAVNEFDWYVSFFEEIFGMTVQRTAKEAPHRSLWFNEGIQIVELPEKETLGTSADHISIGVDDIPGTVDAAVEKGCTRLPNGAHWFALPNGVKMELKPY